MKDQNEHTNAEESWCVYVTRVLWDYIEYAGG